MSEGNDWGASESKGGFDAVGSGSGRTWTEDKTAGAGFGGGFAAASALPERGGTFGGHWDSGGGGGGGGFRDGLRDGRKQEYNFRPHETVEVPHMDVKKNFYIEHPKVAALSDAEVVEIRKSKNDIKIEDMSGKNRPLAKPVSQFEEAFHNYPEILETIAGQKFPEPTPIQCQLWPVALTGSDVIGIAQTGTGKTLGFLLPAFIHIDEQELPREKRGGPTALVLTPTRELAQQIREEVRKYAYKGIRSVCVYGGGSRRSQAAICGEGVDIVIATPGRLGDLVSDGTIVLPSISFLVLDEADRMLDMGFEPQIRDIIGEVRSDRHTIMTSATWPRGVQRMADKYLKDPFLVFIGSLSLTACHNVSQHVGLMRESEKVDELCNFLEHMVEGDKALVFVSRKVKCDEIARAIRRQGKNVVVMHGDKDQSEREEALSRFKTGRSPILVATDVASRGLDVKDITHVLNYDFPTNMEEYVHRIGRSGRAGKLGLSVTFITKRDMHQATQLIRILREASQEVPDGLVRWSAEFQANQPSPVDVSKLNLAPPGSGAGGGEFCDPSGGRRRTRDRGPKEEPGGFYDPFTGERIGTMAGFNGKGSA